ncbi:tetranectin [Brachyhypopomus gauderio]|uniref:tetranectin n=1 Tax=Brachyhypopomus gauderio TaxID=698409 RepID=UPI0040417FD0
MEARVACLLIGVLLIQGSQQQSAIKKKPPIKKDVKGNSAIEDIQKQIKNIVAELNVLKQHQALQAVCLRGEKTRGKCLLTDSEKKNYYTASEDCIAKGGTLSTPRSSGENLHLAAYVNESVGPSAHVWLGFNDMQAEGTWVDLTGSAARFHNWDASPLSPQPDGGTSENCAVLSATPAGTWLDENCGVKRASVCEFKIV